MSAKKKRAKTATKTATKTVKKKPATKRKRAVTARAKKPKKEKAIPPAPPQVEKPVVEVTPQVKKPVEIKPVVEVKKPIDVEPVVKPEVEKPAVEAKVVEIKEPVVEAKPEVKKPVVEARPEAERPPEAKPPIKPEVQEAVEVKPVVEVKQPVVEAKPEVRKPVKVKALVKPEAKKPVRAQKKPLVAPPTEPVALVIRLRGEFGVPDYIERTLTSFRLKRKFNATLVQNVPTVTGMLRQVKDYVTWGDIKSVDIARLLKERGELTGGSPVTNKFVKDAFAKESVDELAKAISSKEITLQSLWQKGVKPIFRLHPPSRGFDTTIKRPYGSHGQLGYRGAAITTLMTQMT